MLLVNISGAINAGKSTVSRLLAQKIPKSIFVEIDDLLPDAEQEALNLDFMGGIMERLRRFDDTLILLKTAHQYDVILFAYPINTENFKRWSKFIDKKTKLISITLSPSLETCLKNRGTRELNEQEILRIKEMYAENYHQSDLSDFIVCTDNQTPKETAAIIKRFIEIHIE